MAKKKQKTLEDTLSIRLNASTITREELLEELRYWQPVGSGPLSVMREVCRLLIQIGELRGFEPFTYDEVNNRG